MAPPTPPCTPTFSPYCDDNPQVQGSLVSVSYTLSCFQGYPSPWPETLWSFVHIPPFMCLGTSQDCCCDTLLFWGTLALSATLITL